MYIQYSKVSWQVSTTVTYIWGCSQILATRFAANNGVDVNYIDFIQSVDPLYVGQIMEGEKVPVKT